MAYDNPVPGYKTKSCNIIRLWQAKPTSEFDLKDFEEGKYYESLAEKQHAELITSVLCYCDESFDGQVLRLK